MRDIGVTGVQTCALPIYDGGPDAGAAGRHAGGDPDVPLVALPGDRQRRHAERRQLAPERRRSPRSHSPERAGKLPRIVAQPRPDRLLQDTFAPSERREEWLPVPVIQEDREVARLELPRPRLVGPAPLP